MTEQLYFYEPLPKRGTKDDCPHHKWDEFGRPIPPAGYCGPSCEMRPTPIASQAATGTGGA